MSVLIYDANGFSNDVKTTKKILALLSRMELTTGFESFMQNYKDPKSSKYTICSLIPSKHVLI